MDDATLLPNRRHWDDRAAIHARDATGFHRIAAFHAGADMLTSIEDAGLGEVAGLRLAFLHEHDLLPWRPFSAMQPDAGGPWRFPDGAFGPPLAFSLMATRPG